ncbi:hypothetical protein FACS1894105_09100 [Clostridia bacterium]|nr:hypothetical protein FACS1894105_09100 [Clostridia bacterium]
MGTGKGITKSCTYGYDDLQIKLSDIFFDDALLRDVDSDIRELELNGGVRRNVNEYKNTTETEAISTEKAIELAKNEVSIEYDRIFAGFDETKSI